MPPTELAPTPPTAVSGSAQAALGAVRRLKQEAEARAAAAPSQPTIGVDNQDPLQRRLEARTAEERSADVARQMREAQDRQDAERAAQRGGPEEPAPLEEHIPAEDRPMARSLFRRLGGLTVSVGKNWINNLDPRGKDAAWRWGALTLGAGEAAVMALLPTGPGSGLVKAGINLALAQTAYAGAKTWYARAEKQAFSLSSGSEEGLEDITDTRIRQLIAGQNLQEQELNTISEKRKQTNQKIRNFFLGASAAATYLSATGLLLSAGGFDEQIRQRFESMFSSQQDQVSTPATAPASPSPSPSPSPTPSPSPSPLPTETAVSAAAPAASETPTAALTATVPPATETVAAGAETPTPSATPTTTATAPAAPQAAPPPAPQHLVGPDQLPPPAYEPPPAAPPRPLPVGPEQVQPAYQPPQFASVPRPVVGPDQFTPPAYEPPAAVTTVAKDSLEKLLAANPDLAKAPAALVGEYLNQTDIATQEALTQARIDPSQLSADSYEKIRMAVQHKLEGAAQSQFENLAGQTTNPDVIAHSLREEFVRIIDTPKFHESLVDTAKAHLENHQIDHGRLMESVAQEIIKPESLAEEVVLKRGDTVYQLLIDHGHSVNLGTADAEVLGAHIAANHDLLNNFWGQMASSGNLPEGFHYPADLAEISDLVEKAKNGDAQALQKLKDALHWVPAGQKFKILSKAGISGVLSVIK